MSAPTFKTAQHRYHPWTNWRAWESTLQAWWDSLQPVQVLQPIAGFHGHTVGVGAELAITLDGCTYKVHVGRCSETGVFRVRYAGPARILPPETPCWCLELVNLSFDKPDLIITP